MSESARADSPTPVCEFVRLLVPTVAPAATQAKTSASHSAIVVRGRPAAAR